MSGDSKKLILAGDQIYELKRGMSRELPPPQLVQIVSRINQDFSKTAMGLDYETNIFYMLSAANKFGWAAQLIVALLDECPEIAAVAQVAASIGIVSMPDRRPENLQAVTGQRYRGWVTKDLVRLSALIQRWVCRIGIPGTADFGGTGVLVGPDIVLTNDHVIESLGPAEFNRVECLFDYLTDVDAIVYENGQREKLNIRWRPITRPASDEDGKSNGAPPRSEELDYALLRLERPIGEEPIRDGRTSASKRGWLRLYAKPASLGDEDQIVIFQHPQLEEGKPQAALRSTFGDPRPSKWSNLRVRYSADTLAGASGSPCFNQRFEFVAIHHAGEPGWKRNGPWPANYNQGIPATAIVEDLLIREDEITSQGIPVFWEEGPPQPLFGGMEPPPREFGGGGVNPKPTPPAPLAIRSTRPEDSLFVSEAPLMPMFNRAKLRANLTGLRTPLNNYRLTRVTGEKGAGKSYSFQLIRNVAREHGVIPARADLQGKSLQQCCELITRAMKLNLDDMRRNVLIDRPDDGPLVGKFIGWLSSATAAELDRRWWLVLDGLDQDSVFPNVRDLFVTALIEAVELEELPSVHIILIGYDAAIAPALAPFSQTEDLKGILRSDIEVFLKQWLESRQQALRDGELNSLIERIAGSQVGPFRSPQLDEIRQKTALVIAEVLS